MENTQDKRGKIGSPERRAYFQELGRRGGNKTKKRFLSPSSPDYDPEYYSKHGKTGGDTIMKIYGKEHLANLGRMKKAA